MARTDVDMCNDIDMMKKLKEGDRVEYISKVGTVKRGVITKFTKYNGRYNGGSKYCNYSSVTVVLDGTKKHINVSPRNLKKISEKKKRSMNEAELAALKAKIQNLLASAVGEMVADNILKTRDEITENSFLEDVIESVLELSGWANGGSYCAKDIQTALGHEFCARLDV